METYSQPGGETFFALHLAPRIGQLKRKAHDVVVLFDTSASQAGAYRETALAALDGLLAAMDTLDRVAILAVDLHAVPLTPSLVGAEGDAMRKALGDLQKRVPLGATDMNQALESALGAFGDAEVDRPRSVVYIGDGMSTARLMLSKRLREVMDRFVEARVSISSYAVGPRPDLQLLAALARHTGGMLAVDEDDFTGRRAGSFLANAAAGGVVWPLEIELPTTCHGVYFRGLPPLRFDRDTVLLGTIDDAAVAAHEPQRIGVRAEIDGKRAHLAWDVIPAEPSADQAYLARLVEAARQDGGASLPSLGSEGLAELRWLVNRGAWDLTKLAEQALAMGNLDDADRLSAEAGRLDPNNAELDVLRGAVEKARTAESSRRPKPRANVDVDEPARLVEPDGALVDRVERQGRVFEGWMRAEVQNVLNRARAAMHDDPEGAIDALKLAKQRVDDATELSADVRAQLNDRLESALRNATRQAAEKSERDAQLEQVAAETEAREQINRELYIREQKVEQLMARFNALMDEERYRDAEAVANLAEEMAPYRAGLRTAELDARMIGYTVDMRRLRDARHRGFVDELYNVETSHVPTPEEPPILYPDPEVWQMLTERRKKWKSVDLHRKSPSEAKIYDALGEKTEMDFSDQPLSDVIDYLKNRHEIEIQLDSKALADSGLGSDTTITRNVKGVSLRSALRLLLGELDLTYVVRDEILLITTKTEAENMLSTRVYPVGDLVIPIRMPMGGMGGGMMGGMGGRGFF
jgi:hypothetical protein